MNAIVYSDLELRHLDQLLFVKCCWFMDNDGMGRGVQWICWSVKVSVLGLGMISLVIQRSLVTMENAEETKLEQKYR